jgi:uncharacterized protein
MNGGAAIFVKTPGLSPVKTRLAAGLGTAEAEAWYRLAASAVAAVLATVHGVTAYWAVAEPLESAAAAWPGLPVLHQGEGELGERMGRLHAELLARHDFALLLGADTPQVDARLLVDAARWVDDSAPRVVMGPARDGGFWLLGANRQPAPEAWLHAPCGRSDTASGFRVALGPLGEWQTLPMLTDVDEADDLGPMLAEFERLVTPLPEQSRMAEWTRAARACRGPAAGVT